MKNYLLGQELWFIIEEPIMKPTLTPDSEDFEKDTYKEWRKINAHAGWTYYRRLGKSIPPKKFGIHWLQ